MKKVIFSGVFILVFVMYALYHSFGGQSSVVSATSNNNSSGLVVKNISNSNIATGNKNNTTVIVTKKITPQPVVNGVYKNGTYTGDVADAYYGNIQVQAVIQNGKLADVNLLQYPNDRDRSININTKAIPILKSEAIRLQSANVNIVSGATDSSQAFQQSLDSALIQAKA